MLAEAGWRKIAVETHDPYTLFICT